MPERISISWNTLSSRSASRPATAIISISASQPAIHSAAIGLEGVRSIGEGSSSSGEAGMFEPACLCNGQICRCSPAPGSISLWDHGPDRC